MGIQEIHVHRIEVQIPLPFALRATKALRIPYSDLCPDGAITELQGDKVLIDFRTYVDPFADKSALPARRTTLMLSIETDSTIDENIASHFALTNALIIANRTISSFQAATHDWHNAGFISPVGLEHLQLYAEILLDGTSIRDRWPFKSAFSIPITPQQEQDFERFVRGEALPLHELFLANASVLLNRGEYSLAVVQWAEAVEMWLTEQVCAFLRNRGETPQVITGYEDRTLGGKLNHKFSDECFTWANHPGMLKALQDDLNALRNKVIHRGHLATESEAHKANAAAVDFIRMADWIPFKLEPDNGIP